MKLRLATWLLPMAAATVLAVAFTGNFSAQQGGEHEPEHAAHDKLLRKGLLDAMRRGVYLYNERGDMAGCTSVFEGALLTIRPLLHHQDLQKKIDSALANVEQLPPGYQRAFALRGVLDEVADRLAGKSASKEKDTTLKDKDKKDKARKDQDKANNKTDLGVLDKATTDKASKDKAKKDRATTGKKDAPAKDLPAKDTSVKDKKDAPAKDKQAPPQDTGTVSGKVTYDGKPLSIGFVTFVGLDKRTYSANIQPDGTYTLKKGLPVGRYRVTIDKSTSPPAKDQKVIEIPPSYQSADTTPLMVEIVRGKNTADIRLSK